MLVHIRLLGRAKRVKYAEAFFLSRKDEEDGAGQRE